MHQTLAAALAAPTAPPLTAAARDAKGAQRPALAQNGPCGAGQRAAIRRGTAIRAMRRLAPGTRDRACRPRGAGQGRPRRGAHERRQHGSAAST